MKAFANLTAANLNNTNFRRIVLSFFFVMLFCSANTVKAQMQGIRDSVYIPPKVMTGLDELVFTHFKVLEGKHIGFIANQTSRTAIGQFGPDLFKRQKSFKLIALFAPEHGLLGTRKAGALSDSIEHFEGIPVYSLYGDTRKPTAKMLKGIDMLVFDLQDIGVRPYTYLTTLLLSMDAAAEHRIPFVVLDRPNPLSGTRIEGNIRDAKLASFVGFAPVPYLHGMTFGELATMAMHEGWIKSASKLKLTVVKMSGWKRSMYWPETGRSWTAPSPNIPHFENAVGAAMLGALGELGIISIGIGGEKPFLALGSSVVKQDEILHAALGAFPHPDLWVSDSFVALVSTTKKSFAGITLTLPKDLHHAGTFYPAQFLFLGAMLRDSVIRVQYDAITSERVSMFRKVTGTTALDAAFERSFDIQPIIDSWTKDVNIFTKKRQKYLLYQ